MHFSCHNDSFTINIHQRIFQIALLSIRILEWNSTHNNAQLYFIVPATYALIPRPSLLQIIAIIDCIQRKSTSSGQTPLHRQFGPVSFWGIPSDSLIRDDSTTAATNALVPIIPLKYAAYDLEIRKMPPAAEPTGSSGRTIFGSSSADYDVHYARGNKDSSRVACADLEERPPAAQRLTDYPPRCHRVKTHRLYVCVTVLVPSRQERVAWLRQRSPGW